VIRVSTPRCTQVGDVLVARRFDDHHFPVQPFRREPANGGDIARQNVRPDKTALVVRRTGDASNRLERRLLERLQSRRGCLVEGLRTADSGCIGQTKEQLRVGKAYRRTPPCQRLSQPFVVHAWNKEYTFVVEDQRMRALCKNDTPAFKFGAHAAAIHNGGHPRDGGQFRANGMLRLCAPQTQHRWHAFQPNRINSAVIFGDQRPGARHVAAAADAPHLDILV
jgi:hypothetical protein